MKRTLLLAILFNLGVSSMSYAQSQINDHHLVSTSIEWQQLKYGKDLIAVGNINVNIDEKVKFKPDIAEFTISYSSEANSFGEASNQNAAHMKKFNQFLVDSGIKQNDLTTISYRNYEREIDQPIDNQSKLYRASYLIHLNIDQKQFFKAIELLDQHNIHNVTQENDQKYYVFEIEQFANSREAAKQLVQQHYQSIANELNKLDKASIVVTAYDNQEASPQTTKVKKYYVENTLQIKVKQFDLISKIMTEAQKMDIKVNDDLTYTISDEAIEQLLQQHEQMLYTKLADKAKRLLGKDYQLGVAKNLNYSRQSYVYETKPVLYARLSQASSDSYNDEMIDIKTPAESEATLSMGGSFEILRKVNH